MGTPQPPRPPELLDPDVRFLLANERTLLAWVRTALALLAGGLALTQFGERTPTRITIGLMVIALGAMMAIIGYVRFRRADLAIRAARLPSMGHGPAWQVIGVLAFAAVLIIIEVIHA